MKPERTKNKFIIYSTLTALTCAAGTWAIAYFFLKQVVPVSAWILLAFIFALTQLIHKFLMSASKKRAVVFVNSFMATLTAKLFLAIIVVIVVRFADPEHYKFSVLSFAFYYLLFTFIEVIALLPHLYSNDN